jgi:uncharacterized membrane protein
MTSLRRSWPWWRWVLTGLSALALTLSAYLGWHSLVGGSVIGCGVGSPCDRVLNSRWSSVGGVLPVSGLAAGAYLAMLVASLFIGTSTGAPVRRLAWGTMLVLVGAAAGSAVWFIIVQKRMIEVFCPYCTATHITGLLLAALVIWQAPKQFKDDSTDVAPTNSAPVQDVFPAAPRRLAWAGLVLAGILAVCQLAITPPPVSRAGESQNSLPALDPHAVPLVGSPDAPNVVTLLFDYKCPHCQQLHLMLDEAIRRYNSKLAFVLCPTPLNTNCNPHLLRNVDEFKDSCELAKVGLAVWVAKREAFPDFNRWMFTFESGDRWHPRSLDAARTKAVELIGQAKHVATLGDPWINRYLQTSIRIYGSTIQSGSGAIPKLIFGSRWVIPQPNDANDLVSILQTNLAVPKP